MLSVTAAVSPPSIECAQKNKDAEDNYEDRRDIGPNVDVVPTCLQEQKEANNQYDCAED